MAPCASFASFAIPPPPPPPLSSSSTSSSPQFSVSTGTSLPAAQLGVSSTRRPPLPDTFDGILNSGVIACLRAQSGEMAMEAARAAIRGGVSVLEIVMSTPGVLEVVRELRRDYPSCIIGVGTVLSPEDARNAVKAGARFLMSPATIKEVFFDLHGGEVLYIPGVMTPTEVLGAYNSGARIVKVNTNMEAERGTTRGYQTTVGGLDSLSQVSTNNEASHREMMTQVQVHNTGG